MDLVFVGHSLGGAIASIAALWFSPANAGALPSELTARGPKLYTFGMPRVGSYTYAKIHDQYVRDAWRITHAHDPVPHLPWCNGAPLACVSGSGDPYHHGTEVFYESNPNDSKICTSIPINEDLSCSNKYHGNYLSFDDHRCYFNRMIGKWCEQGETVC